MTVARLIVSVFFTSLIAYSASAQESVETSKDPTFVEVNVKSTRDNTQQPSRVYFPPSSEAKPLLIFLHSWSHGLEQDNTRWLDLAKQRGWVFLQPHFRGKNDHPEACGSEFARQDILDAIEWVFTQTEIDRSRIYLAGTSGGGHMAMLMAGYYPDKFSAVSSWVGISDLAAWHASTSSKPVTSHYAVELEKCIGGAPGSSDAVEHELEMRSPVYHLANATEVPLDINTGVHDGHTGSVPVSQSIAAFNAIAIANNLPQVSEIEIEKWLSAGAAAQSTATVIDDDTYSRAVLFRTRAGVARLTIFEGTHEDLPNAGMEFLASIRRTTSW